MTQKNSGEIFARLLSLRDKAGANLHERLTLADKLLSDRDWVRAPEAGGGDESTAIDRLEALCFGDICGALSLPEMLELLRAVPQVEVWKQNRFNLRKMHQEMKTREQARRNVAGSPQATTRTATHGSPGQPQTHTAASSSVVEPESSTEEEVKALRRQLHQRDAEIAQLRRENKKLRSALRKVKEMVANLQSV